jgi:site-specific recombinase XerD
LDVERFLSEQAYSEATADTYRLCLSRFSDWLASQQIPLDQLSSRDFDRYAGEHHWSRNYTYVTLAAIRAYLKWALGLDGRQRLTRELHPFAGKKAPKREPSTCLRALSLEEVRSLTDYLVQHRGRLTYRRTLAMLLLSFDCGLRASEVCNLNVDELNLKDRRVVVRRKRGRVTTNGFGEFTAWALERWFEDRQRLGVGPRVFLTDEGAAVNRQAWRLVCLRLARAAGVRHFAPHAIRRATAVRYREQGAPTADVLEAMGWHGVEGLALYQHYSRLFTSDPLERFAPSLGLAWPRELAREVVA